MRISVAGSLFATVCHLSAEPFRNLDFEEAITSRVRVDPVTGIASGPIEDLLPGWKITFTTLLSPDGTALNRTDSLTSVWYNHLDTYGISAPTGPMASFSDRNISAFDTGLPRDGLSSLWIASSRNVTARLSQRGDVPSDAVGISGWGMYFWSPDSTTELRINGDPLLDVPGVGLDVSKYAGQNVELELYLAGSSAYRLDRYYFVVPEPSAWLLMLSAGLLLGLRLDSRSPRPVFYGRKSGGCQK